MNRKFDYYSSSSFSFSCSPSSFRDGGRRLLLSAITIITIALLVLLPSSSSLFSFYVHANDFAAFASPSSISQSETATTVPVPPPPPPSPPPSPSISSQSSQSQTQEKAVGPLVDNFNLPAGYIIEPFLWNLSMPTSIAVDSCKGTIYVTESIMEYNDDNNSSSIEPSHSSIISLPSEQQRIQVRIVKANISD